MPSWAWSRARRSTSASRSPPGAELLAVLVLPGVVANALTPDTTALLTRFGTAAGAALVNARRYEAAMFLLDVA